MYGKVKKWHGRKGKCTSGTFMVGNIVSEDSTSRNVSFLLPCYSIWDMIPNAYTCTSPYTYMYKIIIITSITVMYFIVGSSIREFACAWYTYIVAMHKLCIRYRDVSIHARLGCYCSCCPFVLFQDSTSYLAMDL